ncbi:response regulator [Paenibacillus sp. 1011MAR3C5]|uniref:response regulator n=1 Tax=Paenibacillus sp. 1011MAR3C5 TaxID=1675787 RepID=UPI000E6C2DDC|nr:response regulator [Paenibacillus sp. 1011MAR3C5]RJE90207.1 response regulator [Paenibacillus sp. 1011MAR3C5]
MIVTYWLAAALAILVLAAAFTRAKRNARRRSREYNSYSAPYYTHSDALTAKASAPASLQVLSSTERLFESKAAREQPLVLIVDDGNALRILMAEMLQEEGYGVLQASTGRDAIAKWLSENPDCVLLDIRLPDMSGVDVLCAIREADNPAPVAIMTAFADADMLAEARRLGIHCLLEKPFDLLHVKQAVRDMAGEAQQREIS